MLTQPSNTVGIIVEFNHESQPLLSPAAWQIIHEFASSDMSLPGAKTHLQQLLTGHYVDTDWRSTLKAVMDAETSGNQPSIDMTRWS